MESNKLEADYNMLDWWKKVVFENYANFEGRARRSEYWYFTLVSVLMMIVPFALLMLSDSFGDGEGLLFYLGIGIIGLMVLGLFLPIIAVAVRRLHDIGKSGWWYVIGLIPFVSTIGRLILLVFYCTDSQAGTNKWGPNPKVFNHDEIDEIGIE